MNPHEEDGQIRRHEQRHEQNRKQDATTETAAGGRPTVDLHPAALGPPARVRAPGSFRRMRTLWDESMKTVLRPDEKSNAHIWLVWTIEVDAKVRENGRRLIFQSNPPRELWWWEWTVLMLAQDFAKIHLSECENCRPVEWDWLLLAPMPPKPIDATYKLPVMTETDQDTTSTHSDAPKEPS